MRSSVDDFPWYPLHRSALACVLVELERFDEARTVLGDLARDDFAALPADNEWLLGMSLAGEASARLGDRETAESLYRLLGPYAGRHAIGHTEGSIGAVDRYLGLLAVALGRLDDATRHLEDAVHVNERMGARPWTAHSRHDLAAVLVLRDMPGDRPRAADLDALALATARDLGMPALAARIEAAIADAAADASSGSPAGRARGVFRREGEYWSISFDGAAVRMKHSKGLAYLAVLLRNAGREVHALDLASDRDGNAAPVAVEGLRVEADGGAGPTLDREAKAAYRERMDELRSDLAEAEAWNDPERAARATAELEVLTAELTAATGLGGRDRPGASNAERARISVTRAIRSALERLEAESPGLGLHLRTTVHTGTYCSYTPDPRAPITWEG